MITSSVAGKPDSRLQIRILAPERHDERGSEVGAQRRDHTEAKPSRQKLGRGGRDMSEVIGLLQHSSGLAYERLADRSRKHLAMIA